jgi:KDO2-lipid IV(A) lauroyltransferase
MMPRRYLIKLGELVGVFLYAFSVPHRLLVKRNLEFCYPEWSPKQVRELSKRVFKNAGITFVELVQATFISRQNLLEMFRLEGEDHLLKAIEAGKGVIIISAHFGNWEVAPHILPCCFQQPMTGVARKMRFEWLDRWLYYVRTRFGNRIIYKKWALPTMMRTLRQGGLLAFFIDQSKRKQGVNVSFFGREATAIPAAALLAIRCNSPVVPIFCRREPDGQLLFQVHSALELTRTEDRNSDLQSNTQKMIDVVEDMVRQYPEQWAWYQRPWKVAHPELYPEWEARRQRGKQRKKTRFEHKGV